MIRFLDISEVLFILKNQIELYGGLYGIRDINLLESAIAMPKATFDSEYLCSSIPEMAAVYCYHICKNHPFVDGNKRVALASTLVFLELNNFTLICSEDELYDIVIKIASSETTKEKLIIFFEKYSVKK